MCFKPELILIVLTSCTLAKEVCYHGIDCFSDDFPYNHIKGKLPKSPNEIGIGFQLFTRSNRGSGLVVKYSAGESLDLTNIDPTKDVKFIMHGFGGSGASTWMHQIKDRLLERGDVNVFLIDWKNGAELPDYYQATANARVVAAVTHMFIQELQKAGADLGKIHLIGFSLGGQLVGEIGKRCKGAIGRISGLDPASPLFENEAAEVRLDQTDAIFVDVIHTNGEELNLDTGGFGVFRQSGHVDFYVNGGRTQPGCKDGIDGIIEKIDKLFGKRSPIGEFVSSLADAAACSHFRSHDLFIETFNSACTFTGHSCANYENFNHGLCQSCSDNSCNVMGIDASPLKANGKLYLKTNQAPPFCAG